MKTEEKNKNKFFNFRIHQSELNKLRLAAKEKGYLTIAEYTRQAIREKILREQDNVK